MERADLFSYQTLSARLWRSLMRAHRSHHIFFWWPLIIVLGLLVVAAFADRPIGLAVRSWPQHERSFFSMITGLGKSDWILIPTLVGMLVAFAASRLSLTYSWRWAFTALGSICAYVFVSVGLAGLITVILKRLIGRGRPLYMEEQGTLFFQPFDIIDWTLHSFPSGHSTTALAFTVVLLTLTNGRFRWPIILSGVAIGISRIVVGDHFFSDVLGGIAVGIIVGILVRDYFATRNWGMRIENRRVRFRMFAGFAPLWRWLRRSHIPRLFR